LAVPPQPTPQTFRRRRALLIVGVLVALVVAAVVFFVVKPFGGGGKHETDQHGPKPSDRTPDFEFREAGADIVAGAAGTSKGKVTEARKQGKEIAIVLNRLYSLAFLDPQDWKSGNYDVVFGFFDLGTVKQRAEADAGTLTLGPDAGKTFSDVQPRGGTLRVRILLNKGGHADTADASVLFRADAKGKDGSDTLIVSRGHYFMQIREGGWTVVAYDVRRSDHPVNGAPTTQPTKKPTPSGSSS
jgi:hypothetical protein